MGKSERKKRIEQVIIAFLSPEYFSITDESEQHKGHTGATATGESHYSIIVKSNKFSLRWPLTAPSPSATGLVFGG